MQKRRWVSECWSGSRPRIVQIHDKQESEDLSQHYGSANGNRTRILALKGLRANRCTIAPHLLRLRFYLGYGKWRALTSTTAAPRQWSPSARGQDLRWDMFFLKADNCSPQARAVGNIFPIGFLLKYAVLSLVDNCVWSAGACLP